MGFSRQKVKPGKGPQYFRKVHTYTVIFDNAQGIAPGTPVLKSGVRIGEVRSIKLDDSTGKVSVTVQIDDEYTIRKSDKPTLVFTDLKGEETKTSEWRWVGGTRRLSWLATDKDKKDQQPSGPESGEAEIPGVQKREMLL